ncbi:hypothetical protein A2U01_0074608, partial [Trifolium medium]|nr:hypothetical protein [Trifolium medium]
RNRSSSLIRSPPPPFTFTAQPPSLLFLRPEQLRQDLAS